MSNRKKRQPSYAFPLVAADSRSTHDSAPYLGKHVSDGTMQCIYTISRENTSHRNWKRKSYPHPHQVSKVKSLSSSDGKRVREVGKMEKYVCKNSWLRWGRRVIWGFRGTYEFDVPRGVVENWKWLYLKNNGLFG